MNAEPPVAASFTRRVFERDPASRRDRIRKLSPIMPDWHRWFMMHRTESGAICATHPWKAGRDNTPDRDAAPARVDAAGVGDNRRRDTEHVDPVMRPARFDDDRYTTLANVTRNKNRDESVILRDGPFRVADPTMTFTPLRAHRDFLAIGKALGFDTSEINDRTGPLRDGVRTRWNPAISARDARDLRTGVFVGGLSNASFLNWYGGIDGKRTLQTLARI